MTQRQFMTELLAEVGKLLNGLRDGLEDLPMTMEHLGMLYIAVGDVANRHFNELLKPWRNCEAAPEGK
jgi:hypothetical protein